MIEVESENLVTIAEARERLAVLVTERTMRRWISKGVRGVVLETILVGGRRYTSTEAILRFLRSLASGGVEVPKNPAVPRKTPHPMSRSDWANYLR